MNDALPPGAIALRSIDAVEQGLGEAGYIANRQISTAIYMAQHLQKPILVEGPAGVGKTELAKSVAAWLKLPLIRMQCYEGLDESKALYEWKYGKQLLYTQILKDKINSVIGEGDGLTEALNKLHSFGDIFYSHHFLEPRPLLRALQQPGGAVLLIDEIDKSDQEFEAFLLEILSDYQVSIPEIGTVGALVPPIVLLTSNSTRDLGDALKRRCLHLHIGFPDDRLEAKIIASRVPGIDVKLLRQLVSFAQQLRNLDLKKVPSVSETIDWAKRYAAVTCISAGGRSGARHLERVAEVRSRYRCGWQATSRIDAQGQAGSRDHYVVADVATTVAPASEPLRRFLQVARGAGLRVSAAEGIDATRAVDLVGFSDRTVLKDTLGLILAKTPDEKALYDEAFNLYFKRDEFSDRDDAADTGEQDNAAGRDPFSGAVGGPAGDGMGGQGGQSLGQLLADDDRAALATAMEQAAREAGIENIRFFTQRNLYARRILDRMGLRGLELDMEAMRQSGTPEGLGRAQFLDGRIEALRDAVRDFVERNLILFARGETEQFREELLKSVRLSNLERRDLDRMRILVRQMAKKLAARYAKTRRRRLRGQLDTRRTLRRNIGWGGIPFVTVWKQKRIEKPRVMVLCDVSGSVAAMAQFLLMFLYAMNEALSDIRSFAFAGSLIEVSEILEKEPVEAAITKIMALIGFGSSNYGNSFADFEDGWMRFVTNKTTVIVLGDARGNRTDPRTDIIGRVSQRSGGSSG